MNLSNVIFHALKYGITNDDLNLHVISLDRDHNDISLDVDQEF